jgi:hypothetical protein
LLGADRIAECSCTLATKEVGMTDGEGTGRNQCDYGRASTDGDSEIMSGESFNLGIAQGARDLHDVLHFDPRRGGGTTYQPQKAAEEGLSYQPPHDPPVVPSQHPPGVEMAAGFAPSMDVTHPDAHVLPPSVKQGDSQIEDDVRNTLRYAAEAAHLDGIRIRVENGVVHLQGTVQSFDDIARVDEIVRALRNVDQLYNELQVQ